MIPRFVQRTHRAGSGFFDARGKPLPAQISYFPPKSVVPRNVRTPSDLLGRCLALPATAGSGQVVVKDSGWPMKQLGSGPVATGAAPAGAGASQAYDMFGADIRCKEGSANNKPAGITAREEITGG